MTASSRMCVPVRLLLAVAACQGGAAPSALGQLHPMAELPFLWRNDVGPALLEPISRFCALSEMQRAEVERRIEALEAEFTEFVERERPVHVDIAQQMKDDGLTPRASRWWDLRRRQGDLEVSIIERQEQFVEEFLRERTVPARPADR